MIDNDNPSSCQGGGCGEDVEFYLDTDGETWRQRGAGRDYNHSLGRGTPYRTSLGRLGRPRSGVFLVDSSGQ